MKLFKLSTLFVLFTLCILGLSGTEAFAQDKKKDKKEKKSKKDYDHTKLTPDRYGRVFGQREPRHKDYDVPWGSAKFFPAIYWNTIGLEYEHSLGGHVTIALRGYYNYGRNDGANSNQLVQNTNYLDPGYLVELMGKFYFHRTAQKGPYASLGASYGELLYFDGNYRPFTVLSRRQSQTGDNLGAVTDYTPAKPYHFSGGLGYQIALGFRGLSGNIFAGVQSSFPDDGGLALQLFIEPGIGVVFGAGDK